MDPSTAILMIKALDCLSARQVVTAENISNANTQNYVPLRASFEDALKQAAAQGDDAVKAFQPTIARAAAGTPEAKLRTDLEMGNAAGTALRYSALVQVLNRQMQIQQIAYQGEK
jgi:flagellar basal-body rod protein FlgB